MRFVQIIGWLVVVTVLFCHDETKKPITSWKQIKVTFNKSSSFAKEKTNRKINFKKTLVWNQKNNSKKNFTLFINSMADFSEEEYSFLNEGKLSITSNNSNPEPIAPFTADFTSFPKELNYLKFFGPAENQAYWYFLGLIKRNCGSCWAFAAAGVVEGVYSWKTGHRKGVSLAKQELVDCAHEKYGYAGCDGCNGCRGDEALEYIRQNGIALTESYPYYAELGTKCLRSSVKRFIRPGAFEVGQLPADSNADQVKSALKEYGPLYIEIVAFENEFKNYDKKVFITSSISQRSKTKLINHATVLIGYGTSPVDGKSYWIIRNSYGLGWGDKGFGLLGQSPNAKEINFKILYLNNTQF